MNAKRSDLHTFDAVTLTVHVLASAPSDSREAIADAIILAATMHADDIRKEAVIINGETQVIERPYLLHPLRNTVRIINWGSNDAAIIISSILHDVVEDHPYELVKYFNINSDKMNEDEVRAQALLQLEGVYGAEIAGILDRVSNPILKPGTPRSDRLAAYAAHVRYAISCDPKTLVVKAADVFDNAFNLHRQIPSSKTVYLAKRYAPLPAIFNEALASGEDQIRELLSPDGFDEVLSAFERGESYLSSIQSD